MDVLLAVQESGPAQFMRVSRWGYAFANVGHVLGLALLFGTVVALDLRLLGAGRRIVLEPLERLLVPLAALGLALALATGALLFSVRASEYAAAPVFLVKMGLLVAALVNVAVAALARSAVPRLAAALSLVLWTGVIIAGRLIGYSAE